MSLTIDINSKNAFNILPSAKRYERSFMHRETITHLAFTKTNFVITASSDGIIKFWRLSEDKDKKRVLDFVKQFKAHLSNIFGLSVDSNGRLMATTSCSDNSIRFFDVINFDMTLFVELDFSPGVCEWIHNESTDFVGILAVTDINSSDVYLFTNESIKYKRKIKTVHNCPINVLKFNKKYEIIVTSDIKGNIEYWDSKNKFEFPKSKLDFEFKCETDLYIFKMKKAFITSLNFSSDFEQFVTHSIDSIIRIWNFKKGKIIFEVDERVSFYENVQINNAPKEYVLETFDFGQRAAKERKRISLIKSNPLKSLNLCSESIFDNSGNFLISSTIMGIKIFDLKSKNILSLIGKQESTERFLKLCLSYSELNLLQISGSFAKKLDPTITEHKNNTNFEDSNKSKNEFESVFTTRYEKGKEKSLKLFCSSFAKNRFFIFTEYEPQEEFKTESETRDVLNERPLKKARISDSNSKKDLLKEAKKITLRTSLGDVFIEVFGDRCPKTVENFIGLIKKKYYDGIIFHRVIEHFMVQTGDPTGSGSGGQSLWGGYFFDELKNSLLHDEPGIVSMANSGPNTNGSQFFITLRSAPWLDGKHTAFGKVVKGMDVIFGIGRLKVSKDDRPVEPVKIVCANLVEN